MKVIIAALLFVAIAGVFGAPASDTASSNSDPAVVVLFSNAGYSGGSVVVTISPGETFDLYSIGWGDYSYWSLLPVYGKCFNFGGIPLQYDSTWNANLHQLFFIPPRYVSATDGPCN